MPSPFGIRRRIKRLLGIEAKKSAEPEVEPEKITLHILGPKGDEQSVTTYAGSTILGASGQLRHPIASGCSDSTCGTCHVEILEGADNLSEPTARERGTLRESGHPAGQRLSCRTEILKGTVKVKAFELV
ncbi:MAG: 2Fe-2S iron-sulfur cluster-binding protein [Pseudomonadota bacterium]|nr:2Fe-2S iron-sulfur cluster-binding protein [Pseudomonadota bacterium]